MNRKMIITAGIIFAAIVICVVAIKMASGRSYSRGGSYNAQPTSHESAKARALESAGDYAGALKEYQRLISEVPNSREVIIWHKKTEELNIKLLFSSVITPKSSEYEIKPGDSLVKIAKDFRTTVELIKKSNGLAGDNIFPGKKIKVWTAPFNIFVDKSQNILLLKSEDEIFKTYTVATGLNNCTPVGTFKIIEKIVDPPWYKPGAVIPAGSPENILGTRWMGLTKEGYGIHGTTKPESLGTQATAGCVRMANKDVEELFSIVAVGTEVTIVD